MSEAVENNDVPALIGPFSIGIQVSSILTGVSIIQAGNYFNCRAFVDDKTNLKLFVIVIICFNIVSATADMGIIWENAVTEFGDYEAIKRINIPRTISLFTDSLISVFCQGFFARRSWKATNRNKLFLIAMIICIVVSFVGAVSTAVLERTNPDIATLSTKGWAILMWLWGTCITDWIISAILIYSLVMKRSDILPEHARNAVSKVLRMVLTTASITSLVAFIDAIVYMASAKINDAHLAFSVLIPRLYIISVLYTLNSRAGLLQFINDAREMDRDRTTTPSRQGNKRFLGAGKMVVVTQTHETSVHKNDGYDFDLEQMNRRPAVRVRTDSDNDLKIESNKSDLGLNPCSD